MAMKPKRKKRRVHHSRSLTAMEQRLASFPIVPDDYNIPSRFMCPITRDVMSDPVIAADLHRYERRSIEKWIENPPSAPPKSPLTNLPLVHLQLKPDTELRDEIQRWCIDVGYRPADPDDSDFEDGMAYEDGVENDAQGDASPGSRFLLADFPIGSSNRPSTAPNRLAAPPFYRGAVVAYGPEEPTTADALPEGPLRFPLPDEPTVLPAMIFSTVPTRAFNLSFAPFIRTRPAPSPHEAPVESPPVYLDNISYEIFRQSYGSGALPQMPEGGLRPPRRGSHGGCEAKTGDEPDECKSSDRYGDGNAGRDRNDPADATPP